MAKAIHAMGCKLGDIETFWLKNEREKREKILGDAANACIFYDEGKCQADGSVCSTPGPECDGFEPLFTLE